MNTKQLIEERFWSKVDKSGPLFNGTYCWLWKEHLTGTGYAQFRVGEKHILVHRFAYELLKGQIPVGLEIDHLCRRRSCVQPEHLEVVTPRDNTLRGTGVAAQAARATHCPQGHPYDLFNTYLRPDGGRDCRRCRNHRSYIYHRRIAHVVH